MEQILNAADISGEIMNKKAILVVSFGTTYAETRELTTIAVKNKIKAAFPDYEVRQAFTSRIIIKKLADRDNIIIDTEKQALDKLRDEGYVEVIVQPLHIEAGDEYEKVARVVEQYAKIKAFSKISIGRPLLYFTGQENRPDDYLLAIEALKKQLPVLENDAAIALMGHGGLHPSNAAYAVLQMKIQDAGINNILVFTIEGYPVLANIIKIMQQNNIKRVVLVPFLLVAGDHAINDMASDDENSFKSQLLAAGFAVETYLHGLGENSGIQDLYVKHVKDVIEGTFEKNIRVINHYSSN